MIRIIRRITASAVWDIEGIEVKLPYRKEYPEPIIVEKVKAYRESLISKAYEQDNIGLCEAFHFFGGIAFIAIGMSCEDEFFACFAYYAKLFAAEWAFGEKCLKSKFIGYEYVFEIMLRHKGVPVRYDFRYILDGIADSAQFCLINEQRFAEYWLPVLSSLMEQGLCLTTVSKRVGNVRVSKYLKQMPEQTEKYLKQLASGYTTRRELISLLKMTRFIFGNDVRSNFSGGDIHFFALLKKIINYEIELQKEKFVTDNRRELNSAKDIWILYQRHGVSLKLLTVDFTKVKQVSLRHELKCFLNHRFSGHIRASDRTFISIFDAVNRLCETNGSIRYFSDIARTDVKKLQLTLENEMNQSKIMTMFSACSTLFRYLCSSENKSRLPKPHDNPFESLRFVNAQKYHENTPYIPDKVISAMAEHLGELNELDRLVFEIFSETGMRAKEVACLEFDCLESARYENAFKLKYIPYKTLKARRRNGLSEHHSVYISEELAEKIRKQIVSSEGIRMEHRLPYIFLHQHTGYKVSMLNVEYFIKKINDLIRKYYICDDSGQPWNFTSRQCRKTLVVNMIENGATATELVYQLGHLNQSTVIQYYAEVKSIKLAKLNSEFFKAQFNVLLSKEQLTEFSEEERRHLYVDFRLGERRVELGFCTRKLCEGACRSRSRTVHCVNCPQLCTGRQYLTHWRKLLQDQQERLRILIISYENACIAGYEEFIEYKQEQRLLLAYKNIVEKLEKSEVPNP